MRKKTVFMLSLITVFLLSGCAALMFGVAEMGGTPETVLAKGETVVVHLPTINAALSGELEKAKLTERGFAAQIQQAFVLEFKDRGIIATEGDAEEGNYLKIDITEYRKGIGFLRRFYIPFLSESMGYSKLAGTVGLFKADGKRELDVSKRGQSTGAGTSGDQTDANVDMMATATVAKLTK